MKKPILTFLALTIIAGNSFAPSQAPATQLASATAPAPTMFFRFENAPADQVLNEISARFGIIFIRPPTGFDTLRISIFVPDPIGEQEAMGLVHSLLAPLGYALTPVLNKPAAYRIETIAKAKKSAPVFEMKE